MNKGIILAVGFAFLLWACKGDQGEALNTESSVEVVEEAIVEPVVEEVVLELQMVPDSNRAVLGENCSGIEASFYYSSKSMSSKECASLLSMLLPSVPATTSKNEVGHIAFIVDNEVYSLAKIVLSPEANYLKFEIDGNDYYHNLSEGGINFFGGLAKD